MFKFLAKKLIQNLRSIRNILFVSYSKHVIKNDKQVIVVDFYGTKFFYSRKNSLDQLLLSENSFDGGMPYILCNLLQQRGGSAVDIGANAGYYTIPFSMHFDHVYAFEPNPSIRQKLQNNISLNSKNNITTWPYAVGENDKQTDFFVQQTFDGDFNLNFGLSSLLERSEYKISKIPVKVVKLDNFLRNKVVKLIKIDVEGTEYDVLKGAIKILRSEKPIVFWEASTTISKTNVKKSFDFLSRLGYSHYLFSSDEKFTKLTSSEVREYSLDINILSMFDFS